MMDSDEESVNAGDLPPSSSPTSLTMPTLANTTRPALTFNAFTPINQGTQPALVANPMNTFTSINAPSAQTANPATTNSSRISLPKTKKGKRTAARDNVSEASDKDETTDQFNDFDWGDEKVNPTLEQNQTRQRDQEQISVLVKEFYHNKAPGQQVRRVVPTMASPLHFNAQGIRELDGQQYWCKILEGIAVREAFDIREVVKLLVSLNQNQQPSALPLYKRLRDQLNEVIRSGNRCNWDAVKMPELLIPKPVELEVLRINGDATYGFGIMPHRIRKLLEMSGLVWLLQARETRRMPIFWRDYFLVAGDPDAESVHGVKKLPVSIANPASGSRIVNRPVNRPTNQFRPQSEPIYDTQSDESPFRINKPQTPENTAVIVSSPFDVKKTSTIENATVHHQIEQLLTTHAATREQGQVLAKLDELHKDHHMNPAELRKEIAELHTEIVNKYNELSQEGHDDTERVMDWSASARGQADLTIRVIDTQNRMDAIDDKLRTLVVSVNALNDSVNALKESVKPPTPADNDNEPASGANANSIPISREEVTKVFQALNTIQNTLRVVHRRVRFGFWSVGIQTEDTKMRPIADVGAFKKQSDKMMNYLRRIREKLTQDPEIAPAEHPNATQTFPESDDDQGEESDSLPEAKRPRRE